MKTETPSPLHKPSLRGISHLAAFFAALALGLFFSYHVQGPRARLAVSIYASGLACLYGVSALYHVPHWGPRFRRALKRLDHATIFIFIAASYTPVCLLVLAAPLGQKFLIIVWSVALLGVLQSLFWIKAPRFISFGIYFLLGWMVVPLLPEITKSLGFFTISLILLSGVLYTTGALIYGFKKPNPWPKVFGYHEIFHVLVIFASSSYVIAVFRMLKL